MKLWSTKMSEYSNLDENTVNEFQQLIPETPTLRKDICIKNGKSLQSFLKLSRLNVDDNIVSRINSVLSDKEAEGSIFNFQKSATKEALCMPIIKIFIFPQWYARQHAIEYCSDEVKQLKLDNEDNPITQMTEEEKNNLLRVDSYAFKDMETKLREKNSAVLDLQKFYKNEETIENIVRNRSASVISDMCKLDLFDVKKEFLAYVDEMSK